MVRVFSQFSRLCKVSLCLFWIGATLGGSTTQAKGQQHNLLKLDVSIATGNAEIERLASQGILPSDAISDVLISTAELALLKGQAMTMSEQFHRHPGLKLAAEQFVSSFDHSASGDRALGDVRNFIASSLPRSEASQEAFSTAQDSFKPESDEVLKQALEGLDKAQKTWDGVKPEHFTSAKIKTSDEDKVKAQERIRANKGAFNDKKGELKAASQNLHTVFFEGKGIKDGILINDLDEEQEQALNEVEEKLKEMRNLYHPNDLDPNSLPKELKKFDDSLVQQRKVIGRILAVNTKAKELRTANAAVEKVVEEKVKKVVGINPSINLDPQAHQVEKSLVELDYVDAAHRTVEDLRQRENNLLDTLGSHRAFLSSYQRALAPVRDFDTGLQRFTRAKSPDGIEKTQNLADVLLSLEKKIPRNRSLRSKLPDVNAYLTRVRTLPSSEVTLSRAVDIEFQKAEKTGDPNSSPVFQRIRDWAQKQKLAGYGNRKSDDQIKREDIANLLIESIQDYNRIFNTRGTTSGSQSGSEKENLLANRISAITATDLAEPRELQETLSLLNESFARLTEFCMRDPGNASPFWQLKKALNDKEAYRNFEARLSDKTKKFRGLKVALGYGAPSPFRVGNETYYTYMARVCERREVVGNAIFEIKDALQIKDRQTDPERDRGLLATVKAILGDFEEEKDSEAALRGAKGTEGCTVPSPKYSGGPDLLSKTSEEEKAPQVKSPKYKRAEEVFDFVD